MCILSSGFFILDVLSGKKRSISAVTFLISIHLNLWIHTLVRYCRLEGRKFTGLVKTPSPISHDTHVKVSDAKFRGFGVTPTAKTSLHVHTTEPMQNNHMGLSRPHTSSASMAVSTGDNAFWDKRHVACRQKAHQSKVGKK